MSNVDEHACLVHTVRWDMALYFPGAPITGCCWRWGDNRIYAARTVPRLKGVLLLPVVVPFFVSFMSNMIRELNAGAKNEMQVGRLLEEYVQRRGVCSMSGSIYDTAWVSMVSKSVDGTQMWLFPSSFLCICETQDESGGWEGADAIDEIVNTLACILALKRHQKMETGPSELEEKIDKAVQFVTEKLSGWNKMATERLAFEILIPSVLDLLELEGITIRFADFDKLRQMNQDKMSKINFSILYKYPSTILHSLESFIGVIDFDKMTPHLRDGSMMGSPSSTAAYLINASVWDDNAERYLRDALENGKRIADGMVTNVFPISTFEFAWVKYFQK